MPLNEMTGAFPTDAELRLSRDRKLGNRRVANSPQPSPSPGPDPMPAPMPPPLGGPSPAPGPAPPPPMAHAPAPVPIPNVPAPKGNANTPTGLPGVVTGLDQPGALASLRSPAFLSNRVVGPSSAGGGLTSGALPAIFGSGAPITGGADLPVGDDLLRLILAAIGGGA